MVDRRVRASVAVLASGLVPFLLARVPAASSALPALGALHGPLGVVLLALGGGVALATAVPLRWPRPPHGAVLFVASLSVYVLGGLHYTSGLQVSGDEPYYLLMAQSLWREQDLDLQDNFAREDWREYTPGPLSTHYGAPRRDGRPYPNHSPGLPVLLAPVYAVGGRTACVVLMSLLAALLGLEVRRLAWRLTGDPAAALLAWAAAAGPPVCFYAFHLYTEVPSALCLAACLNLLLGAPGAAGAGLAALLASFLPWLHIKMIPSAAALGVVALLRLRAGLAVLAPLLTWRMWWGGQCPPGRFLVPLVPVLASALALRAADPARGLARWRGPLLALGLALAGFMAADPGTLMLLNRGSRPTRVWDALSGETPIGRYLPSLTLPDPAEWRVALL